MSPVASDLIHQVRYLGEEREVWIVHFGARIQGGWVPKLEFEDRGVARQRVLKPEDLFPKQGHFKDRFRFLGFEDRVVRNDRLNLDEKLIFAIYEDMRTGMVREVPNRLPRARRDEYLGVDVSAMLSFKSEENAALDFTVLEGESFELPEDPSRVIYQVRKVMPDRVVIEWSEAGEERELEIEKLPTEVDSPGK